MRDRAAFNLKLMQDEPLANTFVRDGKRTFAPRPAYSASADYAPGRRTDSTFSLDALESRLAAYIADTSAEEPLDLSAVPKVSKEQVLEQARGEYPRCCADSDGSLTPTLRTSASRKDAPDSVAMNVEASGTVTPNAVASASETQSAYSKQLAEVPEFADYGAVLKSTPKPVELTERETEYVVSAVKHVFAEHVVFQVSFYTATRPMPGPR